MQGTRAGGGGRAGQREKEVPDRRAWRDTGSVGELVCFLWSDWGFFPGCEKPASVMPVSREAERASSGCSGRWQARPGTLRSEEDKGLGLGGSADLWKEMPCNTQKSSESIQLFSTSQTSRLLESEGMCKPLTLHGILDEQREQEAYAFQKE